jgi:hypothetical protein
MNHKHDNHEDESNPFFHSNKALSALEAGTYTVVLDAIEKRDLPSFEQEGPPRVGLFFKFKTESGDFITKLVNATNNEKSHCVQLAKSLSPAPIGSDVIRDPKKLWNHLQSLEGRAYIVQSEPSACGRYNNLVSAVPAPLAQVS